MPNLNKDLINDTLSVDLDSTQTLSNKTLTTPIINGPTITATGQTPVILKVVQLMVLKQS